MPGLVDDLGALCDRFFSKLTGSIAFLRFLPARRVDAPRAAWRHGRHAQASTLPHEGADIAAGRHAAGGGAGGVGA